MLMKIAKFILGAQFFLHVPLIFVSDLEESMFAIFVVGGSDIDHPSFTVDAVGSVFGGFRKTVWPKRRKALHYRHFWTTRAEIGRIAVARVSFHLASTVGCVQTR